jgi:hypothetical protein
MGVNVLRMKFNFRMKGFTSILMLLLIAGLSVTRAQTPSPAQRVSIAVFSPLYLDSAFDASYSYRYGKNFPKFFSSGLEFFEGAQLAIDTLEKEGVSIDVHIYDTRMPSDKFRQMITGSSMDSFDLLIGHVNATETKQLADVAASRNIPFINATYPNDAGVKNNPNLILLNSTLFTHCSAIYKFLQKNFALSPVTVFRKKGAQEDRLRGYFEEIAKGTSSVPLKINYVNLDENFTIDDLRKNLQEEVTNVCIAGSLDVTFGQRLTQHLATLNNDRASVLFAMPTWWDVADFTKPEFKGLEVYFTTPFYMDPNNKIVSDLQHIFKTRFFSRPTDMVYRGYETIYHFAHLLLLTGKNFGSSLSDDRFTVFTDFNIQPVLDPKTMTLDYFENKKIHFVKKIDGLVTAVY